MVLARLECVKIIGLSGAHRSGKSTLARDLAKALGVAYHDASTSRYAKEFGVSAVDDLPMKDRFLLQKFILKRFLEDLDAQRGMVITDRTPIDMIGYTLAELTMHNTDLVLGRDINDYCAECMLATAKRFQIIIVPRPLPVFVEDPKSPPPNLAYQLQHQLIVEGVLNMMRHSLSSIYLSTNIHDERLDYCLSAIGAVLAQHHTDTDTVIKH